MHNEAEIPANNPKLAALQASFANEFDDEPTQTEVNQAKIETIEYLEEGCDTPDINLPAIQIDVNDVKLYHTQPEKLVAIIKQQAGSFVFDISNTKGRNACRSHAATIIRCITPALNTSKSIAAEAKKVIDADLNFRKNFESGVRAIAEATRKPLTEWEAEQDRVEKERLRLEAEALEKERLSKQYQDDWSAALVEHELFEFRKEKAARDAIELAEQQAKAQAEYEQKIKHQASEQERLRLEAEQREREEAQAREIERLEREKSAAIEREAKAKQAKIEADAKAEQQAKAREQLAAENERKRIEQEIKQKAFEQAKIDAEEKKKSMDLQHRGRVNHEIYVNLTALGVEDELAKNIIRAAVKRELGAMVINY